MNAEPRNFFDRRVTAVLCQVDAIGNGVSLRSADYDVGELRQISLSLQAAANVIEREIRWRTACAAEVM